MEYSRIYSSPLGILTLTASEAGLTGLYLREPTDRERSAPDTSPHLDEAVLWLDHYFAGKGPNPETLTLIPKGSDFQKIIWSLLAKIPCGETRTYGALAREAASLMHKAHMSAQAVGGAVGRNPISIIIPCHRCVAAGGKLGGFGWGPDAKKWLLRHEGGSYDDQ